MAGKTRNAVLALSSFLGAGALGIIIFVYGAFQCSETNDCIGNKAIATERVQIVKNQTVSDIKSTKEEVEKLTKSTKWEIIKTIWRSKKNQLAEQVLGNVKNKNFSNSLYLAQQLTNSLLRAAAEAKEYEILDDLAELYLIPYDFLELKDAYLYRYLPGKPLNSLLRLPYPSKMWVNKGGEEDVLSSAQFLYVVSNATNLFLDIEKQKRTPSMNRLIEKFTPVIIKDHYERWIFGEPGVFQVRGWGCNDGVFNHSEFMNKKLGKEFGTTRHLNYCNAVTDTDLWIIAGVVEMLSASHKSKLMVPIDDDLKERILAYVDTGTKLLRTRITNSQLKNFDSKTVNAANFDLGAWDDYPDYAYSGYSGEDFPSEKDKKAAKNVGWDISHARRFMYVFESLYRNRGVTGQEFPNEEVLACLANQLVYGTFNRDFRKPAFTNFMDGTNGWYRAEYSGRKGFGYGPYDLSVSAITGGYGFWSKYNQDIRKVMDALWTMMQSQDPDIVSHRERFYESNYYQDFARKKSVDFNPQSSWEVLNFLSAYATSK